MQTYSQPEAFDLGQEFAKAEISCLPEQRLSGIINMQIMTTQPQKMDRIAFWFLMGILILGLLILAGMAITPVVMFFTGH